MSRIVSRAESWEKVYGAFENINFAAFDYNTIKQSLLDYIKLYFPESFNDFIETSEFIAIIESFAYIAEQIAYRLDVNAHENFLSTAQRRDSILRLAKLVSYTASRPLPARGLVKITSISTTENVIDANGNDLAGVTVRWNDNSNSNWKDQFILLMNRILDQDFGTVGPNDRFQIQDVLFEIYGVGLSPLSTGVFRYTASTGNTSAPMELVPVEYNETGGIIERRPTNNSNFTWLYASDGLGDGSETTGFLCLTKQGTLQRFRTSFDGVTSHQFYDVPSTNVNDTDIWLNNVDPQSGATLDIPNPLSFRPSWYGKSGEWIPVDLAFSQNIIFNTNPNRNKYEIETRDESRVRLIFGDGEFADIPSGTFDVWVRTSVDDDIVISQSAVVDIPQSFTYVDSFGRTQTFTFTISLISSLQNASAAETNEHIRTIAPAVYYTQDRMVNGQDYNTFMLQDSSILKLRSVNRTFAGDSKYIPWHDGSESYENVKMYGDDGVLYFEEKPVEQVTPSITIDALITNYIEPLLSSTDILVQLNAAGVPYNEMRSALTTIEKNEIASALTPPPSPTEAVMYFNVVDYKWYTLKASDDPSTELTNWPADYITTPLITVEQNGVLSTSYTVTRQAKRIVFESQTTKFWNSNSADDVIDYDSLTSNPDTITILKANVNAARGGVLEQNWLFDVVGQEIVDSGTEMGLVDIHRLSVLPQDADNDGTPDNLDPNDVDATNGIADIINYKTEYDFDDLGAGVITFPIYFVNGRGDVSVTGGTFTETGSPGDIVNEINITGGSGILTIVVNDYVYFTRETDTDVWYPTDTTYETIASFLDSEINDDGLWKRHNGREALNFAWFHYTSRYSLVDPAPTNIIDTFIITKGQYTELKRWLEDPLAPTPSVPTPLQLRTAYSYMLDNKMISDAVILHPGRFKLLFGPKASSELQVKFKIIRTQNGILTDNQVKTTVVATIRNFFDVTLWEFGETFFFTELASAIHASLPTEISSVVLVPQYTTNQFGDMFQIAAREDEVFYPDVSVDQVEIVTGYTATNLRLNS